MGKITDEMKAMIEKEALVFSATATKDGVPNVSPKGSIRVWDENTLIFVERNSPRTTRNLKENPRISIVVLDKEKSRGFQFKGKAEMLEKGPLYEEVERV